MYQATIKAIKDGKVVRVITVEEHDARFAAFRAVEEMDNDAVGAYADEERVIELKWMP